MENYPAMRKLSKNLQKSLQNWFKPGSEPSLKWLKPLILQHSYLSKFLSVGNVITFHVQVCISLNFCLFTIIFFRLPFIILHISPSSGTKLVQKWYKNSTRKNHSCQYSLTSSSATSWDIENFFATFSTVSAKSMPNS